MKPFSKIRIGDVHKNPITGTEWYVIDKNHKEKMVKISMLSFDGKSNLCEIWKKNTDKFFARFPLVVQGPDVEDKTK